MRRAAGIVVAVLAGGHLVGSTQGPASPSAQPSFKTGTTLVEVSAVITANGRPVPDLRVDEVTVLDNGDPQSVVHFEYVDLGRGELPTQRRDFVIVIDDLHIQASQTAPAIVAALAFVDALGPHDRVAVIFTAPPQGNLQLTTDRDAARELIRRSRGQYAPAALLRAGNGGMSDEAAWRARDAMDVLKQVARAIRSDAAERRAVLLVSEGHNLLTPDISAFANRESQALGSEFLALLREAALANVAIYTVDPRGLRAQDTTAVPSRKYNTTADAGPSLAGDTTGSLATLAVNTGGIQTRWTNDLTANYARLLQDSRQYYRLAYVQPEPSRGKKQPATRSIKVKVTRPGVEVRARQRYAPAPSGSVSGDRKSR